MKVIHAVHPADFKTYTTSKVREQFLLEHLSDAEGANFVYTHYDRMIAGLVKPGQRAVTLDNFAELRAEFFLERREMGIINVGGKGTVTADGETFTVNKLDTVYLGKGVREVSFTSASASDPAVLFILSCPAHQSYPSRLMTRNEAMVAELGSVDTANQRKILKYIHKDGVQSCQLVMGLTILSNGSVWNTMPPHTHDRRMEIYFYFDVEEDQRVFHYMGEPQETRHILVANHQAVISPPWSIHAGSGTKNYSFIWGMAGENMEFSDMDAVAVKDVR